MAHAWCEPPRITLTVPAPLQNFTTCSSTMQEHSFSSAASGYSDPGSLKALSFSATTPGEQGEPDSTIKAVKRPSAQQGWPAGNPQPVAGSVQLHGAGQKDSSQTAELTVEESAGSSVSPAECPKMYSCLKSWWRVVVLPFIAIALHVPSQHGCCWGCLQEGVLY